MKKEMVETVEIMEAGAKPALCKCATKSIIMATDTGKVGMMPNDWKNPTSFGQCTEVVDLTTRQFVG